MTYGVISFLIDLGFQEVYGSHPLRRAIERNIEDPLAEHILRREFEASKDWMEERGEGDDAKKRSPPTRDFPPLATKGRSPHAATRGS